MTQLHNIVLFNHPEALCCKGAGNRATRLNSNLITSKPSTKISAGPVSTIEAATLELEEYW